MDFNSWETKTDEDIIIVNSLKNVRVFEELFEWSTEQFYVNRLREICKKVLNAEEHCVSSYVQPLFQLSKRFTSESLVEVSIENYKILCKLEYLLNNQELKLLVAEFEGSGIFQEQLQNYSNEVLALYWFLIKNQCKIPSILSDNFDLLKSTGFFRNPMMLNAINFLTEKDLELLKENPQQDGVFTILLDQIVKHPNCINYEKVETTLKSKKIREVDWCHLVVEHQNLVFPIYKIYLFKDEIEQFFMNKNFLVNVLFEDNVIIIQILKMGEIQRIHKRVYPKLSKSFDPVLQYVDDFFQKEDITDHFSEKEKVSALFFAVMAYRTGDVSWIHAFHSSNIIAYMTNYEYGNSLYDALWSIVSDRIHADNYQPVNSLTSPIIYINAVKINLLDMLEDAKSFLDYVVQFATNLFVYFPEDDL